MIYNILFNKALASALLGWFIAQTMKAVFLTLKQKKFRFDLYSLREDFLLLTVRR
jgi:acid phosphatase family membrane protein YuiD